MFALALYIRLLLNLLAKLTLVFGVAIYAVLLWRRGTISEVKET
jgi:hypothetical protein